MRRFDFLQLLLFLPQVEWSMVITNKKWFENQLRLRKIPNISQIMAIRSSFQNKNFLNNSKQLLKNRNLTPPPPAPLPPTMRHSARNLKPVPNILPVILHFKLSSIFPFLRKKCYNSFAWSGLSQSRCSLARKTDRPSSPGWTIWRPLQMVVGLAQILIQ